MEAKRWEVDIWDVLRIAGIRDRKSFLDWCKRGHPDKGGDTNVFGLINTFYGARKADSGDIGPPPSYTRPNPFKGGGVPPRAPPPPRPQAKPTAPPRPQAKPQENPFQKIWRKKYEEDVKRQTGDPKPGMCHAKVKKPKWKLSVFSNSLDSEVIEVNCQNMARKGSRYCHSHKKFDTEAEKIAVEEYKVEKAATKLEAKRKRERAKAERARTKIEKTAAKRAQQQQKKREFDQKVDEAIRKRNRA